MIMQIFSTCVNTLTLIKINSHNCHENNQTKWQKGCVVEVTHTIITSESFQFTVLEPVFVNHLHKSEVLTFFS